MKIKKKYSSIYIEGFNKCLLRPGIIVDEKIKDSEAFTEVLKNLIEDARVKKQKVIFSLPASGTITKQLSYPKNLNTFEIRADIAINLKKIFPGINENLCFDFQIKSQTEHEQKIILIAARISFRDSFLAVIEAVGLTAKLIDINAYAMIRGIFNTIGKDSCILLDIHNSYLRFVIAKNSEVIFYQCYSLQNQSIQIYSQDIIIFLEKMTGMFPQLIEEPIVITGSYLFWEELLTILFDNNNFIFVNLNLFKNFIYKNKKLEKEVQQHRNALLCVHGLILRNWNV